VEGGISASPHQEVSFKQPLADPLERLNRSTGYLNHGIMLGIVDPTSRVYRTVLPRPVRKGIDNAGENLAYPVRLVNNLLQGQIEGAGVETKRFAVNTTVGLVGLFDPATSWGIGSSKEDTGLTLGKWGWNPHAYLTLPLFGPSSDRNLVGRLGDWVLDPATYLLFAGPVFSYNRLADDIIPYKQFTSSQYDPYALSRDLWALTRKELEGEGPSPETGDAAVQTLQVALARINDERFPSRGKKRKVPIASTGEELPYTLWLQRDPAHVVYILPGLGGHREESLVLAFAEEAFNSGFSVVAISSVMNWEFMKYASTAPVPGYSPVDVRDVSEALESIHRRLLSAYSGRVTGRSVMGFSLGAFHTLLLAAGDSGQNPAQPGFDRYVAVNPPVDLLFGVNQLDSFYNAPLSWPVSVREEKMEQAQVRSVQLATQKEDFSGSLPLSSVEAKYIIGLWYRLSLRDVIHASQRRHNMGVLRSKLGGFNRKEAYEEIIQYSYTEYFESFVWPYVRSAAPDQSSYDAIRSTADLKSWSQNLAGNPKVRIFTNENDFLLSPEDLAWLRITFPEDRIQIGPDGGHLGNLYEEEVQVRIVGLLSSGGLPSSLSAN
jgi:ABC-type transporter lipoprotein component MlaA